MNLRKVSYEIGKLQIKNASDYHSVANHVNNVDQSIEISILGGSEEQNFRGIWGDKQNLRNFQCLYAI